MGVPEDKNKINGTHNKIFKDTIAGNFSGINENLNLLIERTYSRGCIRWKNI